MQMAQAGPVGWAHQAADFQSNGAVTVKSLSGGSYAGTQNPTGAVAKVNQLASTQPPTVIIQATSTGYAQVLPLVNNLNTAILACPAGYTSAFSMSGTGCPAATSPYLLSNLGGTRYSLTTVRISTYNYNVALQLDNEVRATNGLGPPAAACYEQSANISYPWSVNICSK
jgi:hypothetical protein